MHKIAIGSWAYTLGPYENDPTPFDVVMERVSALGFDGLELGAFGAHPGPDQYPTRASRKALAAEMDRYGLQFAVYAPDLWSEHLGDAEDGGAKYLDSFRRHLAMAADLGIKTFRVDAVHAPSLLDDIGKERVHANVVDIWQKAASLCADEGMTLVWEFEPGFIFNRPSDIARVVEDVGAPNFGLLFDTCHAHMVAAHGVKQTGGPVETLDGGALALAKLLRGKIKAIHIGGSDGTLYRDHTSNHVPLGEGELDLAPLIRELSDNGALNDNWWSIDLCFWPDAWNVSEACRTYLKDLDAEFSKKESVA